MSQRPAGVSAPGLLGEWASAALALTRAVSSGMRWDLRLGRLGRVWEESERPFSIWIFPLETSGLACRGELS